MFDLRSSLAAKWLVFQIVGFGLILCVVGVYQYGNIRDSAYKDIEDSGKAVNQAIQEMLAENPHLFDAKTLQPVLMRLTKKIANIKDVSVINQSRQIIADSNNDNKQVGEPIDQNTIDQLLQESGDKSYINESDEGKFLRLSYSVEGRYEPIRKNNIVGVMTMDIDLAATDAHIINAFLQTMMLLTGLLFLFWIIQYILARRGFLHRVHHLTSTAESFGNGNLTARARIGNNDEMGQLAVAFNRMATDIEQSNKTLKTEIAERNLAEDTLQKEREFLAALLENISDGMAACDADGVLTLFNRATREFHGLPEKRISGDEWATQYDLFMPDGKTLMEKEQVPLFRALQNGSVRDAEMVIAPKGLPARRVIASGQAIFDASGIKRGAVVGMHDVTERIKIEKALRESEEKNREIIENAGDTIYTMDLSGNFTSLNRAGERITGYTEAEALQMKIADVINPEDEERVRQRIVANIKGAELPNFELEIIAKAGRKITLDISSRMILRDGKPVGIQGIGRDITERKKAETLLKNSEEFNRSIFENSPDCVKVLELDGTLHSMNANGLCIMEIDDFAPFVGEAWVDFWQGEQNKAARKAVEDARNGKSANFEGFCKTAKGKMKYWDVSVAPIFDAAGKPCRLISTSRDVTERKRAETERQVISEIIEGISTTPNLEELLAHIHHSIKKIIYAENFFVALYDKKTELFEMQFFVDQYDTAPAPFKLGKSRAAYVFRQGHPLLMNPKTSDQLRDEGIIEVVGTPSASWLGVPLRTPTEVIGVLVVQHYEDEQAYSQRDLELLTSVGDQIALAIERKQSEDALKQSQEWLAAMFEASQDAIVVEESEHIVFANSRYLNLYFDGNRGDVVGSHVTQFQLPEDSERMIEYGKKRAPGEEAPTVYEFKGVNKEDKIIDLEASISTFTSNGKFYIVTAQKDITERKRIEEELKARETQLNEAQAIAHVGSWEWTVADNKVAWSDELYRIFGLKPQELDVTFETYLSFVHPDDREHVTKTIERTLRDKKFYEIDNRIIQPDGTVRVIRGNAIVILNESGSPVKITGTSQDITEQKHAEDAVRESERRLFLLLDAMPVGVFVIDALGNPYYSNNVSQQILGSGTKSGVTPDQLGEVYQAYLSGTEQLYPADRLPIVRALNGETLAVSDMEIHRTDRVIPLEVTAAPICDSEGKIIFAVAAFLDITERKRIEEELEQTRDAALESARLKSEFLANMSHEIRTPMNGVIGMTGLLLDTELNDEQSDYAETIRLSADSLLSVINDILDFSKIEAGKLHFEKLDFDLCSVVESTVALLAERAQSKGIELASLVDSDVPLLMRGDAGRLKQVLLNLTGNAVKFTERGEVSVFISKENETETHATIRFEVRDTGIGISNEQQKRLFQAFVQADGSTTRKYGGTGLGLAISKQIVEMMGGNIGIQSEPNKGSTFYFTVRLEKQSPDAVLTTKARANLHDLRVLIVDDNATNRRILNHQTASWGMFPHEAESGRAALESLRVAAQKGEPYDVALLDFNMPEMNGFELARAIKADEKLRAVRLVLMPSFGNRGDGQTAREIGIAAYLMKPVKQSQLFDCLATVVGEGISAILPEPQQSGLVTRHSLKENKFASTTRILIAEDNPVNQKVAKRQVEKLGYEATVVGNGIEALAALAATSYDIVLMDCQMPEMDGYEATAEIRRREGAKSHTIVIALTANALEGEMEKCLAAGMDDYLSKPVDVEQLQDILERWQPSNASVPSSAKNRNIPVKQSLAPVDLIRLRDAAGDDEELMHELIEIYLRQMSENLEKLKTAVKASAPSEVKLTAHTMTGGSATCGMIAVLAPLRELEQTDYNPEDLENALPLIVRVEEEFERIKEFLKESLTIVG